MQVFRLMGMPDKVIAFDELPERLLQGFEMARADGFPRYWKEWMGKRKKITQLPPEKDAITGQIRRFDPIIEEDSFFYMLDWMINPVVEKWKEVCDYVRQHVSQDTRLMDKLEDMALPLAANKTDSVSLEPDEVVIIPLPKESVPIAGAKAPKTKEMFGCKEDGCQAEFDTKQGVRLHTIKKHRKEPVSV